MSAMEADVFEAFRSVGIADDKAILAAQALGKRDPDTADLKQDMSSVKADIGSMKQDVAGLKTDVGTLKTDVAMLKTDMVLLKWMVGLVIATSLTILFRVFHG